MKYFLLIEMSLKDYGDNLYHVRNEKYNGKECYVVKVGEDKKGTYWIDTERGFILKYEHDDGTKEEFEFKIDKVTDKDVEEPNVNM